MTSFVLHEAPLAGVAPRVLYAILRVRVDVFVVEQECAYPELDGRDLEPDALLLWAEDASGSVVATSRLLRDPDGRARIGRVATAAGSRRAGVAGSLIRRALTLAPGVETVLDAQAHLAGWYARFGFVVDGPPFDEDGIAHVPMVRAADA
ncbi:MAG: GNAT family N-acetyltransferase [Janthinobacterium lividum]